MFESRQITDDEYRTIINTIRQGYVDLDGITRKPNEQVADILVLEANLGCRINDIISLRTDSFALISGVWQINIVEQKTKKKRVFIVPSEVKAYIDEIAGKNYTDDERLFSISAPAVWKALKICRRSLGYDNIGSHSFRKKAAYQLYVSSGYDVSLVCSFLQHHSPATTQRYLKRSTKQMETAISKAVSLV